MGLLLHFLLGKNTLEKQTWKENSEAGKKTLGLERRCWRFGSKDIEV
jgi:hypothetical protein